jgi:hypothetical protein
MKPTTFKVPDSQDNPHRETRKGGQGPIWAVAPLMMMMMMIVKIFIILWNLKFH